MNARERAIADIDKYFNSCFIAWMAFRKVKDDLPLEELDKLADYPRALVDLYYKGVPLMGYSIRVAREEKKISLSDMAKRVEITESTLRKYESGEIGYIPYKILERIRKEIGCSKEYLIGLDEDKNDNSTGKQTTKSITTATKGMGTKRMPVYNNYPPG